MERVTPPATVAPLISVVTAVRDGAVTLPRLIDSIATQSFAAVELVVQDGGSRDGTLRVLEQSGSRIAHWASEPDSGIYDAWNRALRHVKGEWIVFLGADDYVYSSDALQRVAAHLDRLGPSVPVAYGQLAVVSRAGRTIQVLGVPWSRARRRYRQVMALPHPAVFYRRAVVERLGGFDPRYCVAGDFEFLLRILQHGRAHFMHDVIVTAMQVGGISLAPENTWLVLRETYRARRAHVSVVPGLLWIAAVLRMMLRRALWQFLGERRARMCLDWLRGRAGLPPYWTIVE